MSKVTVVGKLKTPLVKTSRAGVDLVLLAAGAVVFVPLVTSKATLDPALAPQFLAWTVVSFLLCLSLLVRTAIKPNAFDSGLLRRAIFPAFVGYFLISIVSLCRAPNVTEGVYEVLKVGVSGVFLLLATDVLVRKPGSVAFLSKAVAITAIVISLVGLRQFFEHGTIDKPGQSLLTGTLGHKNLLASALFLMVPFCLYTVATASRLWSAIGTVAMTFTLLLIVLSRTRAVWLALLVSAVLTGAIAFVVFKRLRPAVPPHACARAVRRMACLAALCVLTGTLLAALYGRSHSFKGVVPAAVSTDSLSQRISIWRKTLEMIRDHAVWGVGAGNWKIVLPSYRLPDDLTADQLKTVVFVRPHNDFLWVLSEIGGLGFLFYMATFAITAVYIVRVVMQRSWTSDTLLSFLMLFGVIGYLVIASFSFSRERVGDTVFLLLIMAVATSLHHRRLPARPFHRRLPALGILALSMPLLSAVIGVGYLRLNAEVHTKKAFAARAAHDWPTVLQEIDTAYSAFATMDPMMTPLAWYRGEAHYASGDLPQAIADYEQAAAAHPYHIHVLNNLATCYVLANRPNDAIAYYEKVLQIAPRFTEAACNLAAVCFNTGNLEKARAVLAACPRDAQNATLERYYRIVTAKLADRENSMSGAQAKPELRTTRPAAPPFADRLKDVRRLWSSYYGRYLLTIDANERDAFLSRRQQAWTDEGVECRAFADSTVAGTAPVYRFYSPAWKGYLYTIESAEARSLMQDSSGRWKYEGIAFYAFPPEHPPRGTIPVYRFWSPRLQYHLYVANKREVKQIRDSHDDTWSYEGVAWYAYSDTP